jgi:undecaprenyl-diphosphatase
MRMLQSNLPTRFRLQLPAVEIPEILQYALLGIVQGLTEFLPVSSSGHLVLLERWMGVNTSGLTLIIALHVATTVAVLIVYCRDIVAIFRERRWRYIGLILLCCMVTAVIFLPFKDAVEAFADNERAPLLVGIALLCTALWQFAADWRLRRDALGVEAELSDCTPSGQRSIGPMEAAAMGVAQAISGLFRGFSRSGSTIGTAIQLGVAREEAARFSFLASIPVVLGGAAVEARDAQAMTMLSTHLPAVIVGFICALLAGIVAIYFVRWALQRARLSYFGAYCLVIGAIAIVVG